METLWNVFKPRSENSEAYVSQDSGLQFGVDPRGGEPGRVVADVDLAKSFVEVLALGTR